MHFFTLELDPARSISSSQMGHVSSLGSSFFVLILSRRAVTLNTHNCYQTSGGPAEGCVVFLALICRGPYVWLQNLQPAVGVLWVRLTCQRSSSCFEWTD